MKDEVLSLNSNDIDVELLEQRIEMSSLVPLVDDGADACSCSDFTCGSFKCLPQVGG
jgi:hypothetical protein